jgi:serine/threonine-protein kinase
MRCEIVGEEFEPRTDEIESLFTGITVKQNIAGGGQKIVYKAEHFEHGQVALKLIRPGSHADMERIQREIEASRCLRGPVFSRVFDWGVKKLDEYDVLYIVEEFLQGSDLRGILKDVGKLGLEETLHIAKSLLSTLSVVHEHRIIHRDIKPENIFVTHDDRIVLLDFGIARHLELSNLTRSSAFFGPLTPGYAAPEQIKNEIRKIRSQTDIFQVGVVVYECLTGHNPFIEGTKNPMEAMKNNLEFDPIALHNLGFPRPLSVFVGTCLAKHPHRRYATAEEASIVVKNILKEVN